MVVAPQREGEPEAQFLQRPVPVTGDGLAATCAWALGRLNEPLTMRFSPATPAWAPRTFARRFVSETGTTPLRWVTAQRLLKLDTCSRPPTYRSIRIAARAGLGTAANLRLQLARDIATTPTAYRRTYRGRDAPHSSTQRRDRSRFSQSNSRPGCGAG